MKIERAPLGYDKRFCSGSLWAKSVDPRFKFNNQTRSPDIVGCTDERCEGSSHDRANEDAD